jgi:hypothetical protein
MPSFVKLKIPMKCGWLIIVCLWAIYFSECSCKRVVIKFDPNFGNGGDIASSFGTIKRELPNYSGFAVEVRKKIFSVTEIKKYNLLGRSLIPLISIKFLRTTMYTP